MDEEELAAIEARFMAAKFSDVREIPGGWEIPTEELCDLLEHDIPSVFREIRRLRAESNKRLRKGMEITKLVSGALNALRDGDEKEAIRLLQDALN